MVLSSRTLTMPKVTKPAQSIVITGATRGLGRALAHGFAARGHTVAGCGRSSEGIDELRRTLGQPHDFAVVDVSRDQEVADWALGVLHRIGPPDLLLNNAAMINHPAMLWEVPAAEFEQVIDVNIKGVVNMWK